MGLCGDLMAARAAQQSDWRLQEWNVCVKFAVRQPTVKGTVCSSQTSSHYPYVHLVPGNAVILSLINYPSHQPQSLSIVHISACTTPAARHVIHAVPDSLSYSPHQPRQLLSSRSLGITSCFLCLATSARLPWRTLLTISCYCGCLPISCSCPNCPFLLILITPKQ